MPVGKYFTVAQDADIPSLLLYSSTEEELNSPEILQSLTEHPVLQVFAEHYPALLRLDSLPTTFTQNCATALITPSTPFLLNPGKYTIRGNTTIHVLDPQKKIRVLDMLKIYEECTLPHKIMGSCAQCRRIDTPRECAAKQISLLHPLLPRLFKSTAQDLLNSLVNRKSYLADYTYISPTLTTPVPPFSPNLRPIAEHDFNCVDYRSKIRSTASTERARRAKFKKEVCSTCLMGTRCAPARMKKVRDICEGPYAYTEEKEAAKHIVEKHVIPYSDKSLYSILMRHTGTLPFRINRKKAGISCRVNRENVLEFGIIYLTKGNFVPLTPGEFQDLCAKLPRTGQYPSRRLRTTEKAILLELACIRNSLTNHNNRHLTSYQTLYPCAHLTSPPQGITFSLIYRWNSIHDNSWERPWSLQVTSLRDIFQHYLKLHTLPQIQHPLGHNRGVF